MKIKLKPFYALLIFTIFLSILFVPNNNAQSKPSKNEQTNQEKEKLEVQKLVNSFYQSLEETKDLNQVPKTFFVADFKTRFAKNYRWFEYSEFFKQLSDSERYDGNVLMINFLYLGMMSTGEKNFNFGEGLDDDEEDTLPIEKMFPSQIADRIRKSKFLYFIYDEDRDLEINNIIELNEFIADIKNVSEVERTFLNENKMWKSNYLINIKEARSKFERYQSILCENGECNNLPQQTKIIWFTSFPFVFSIIRENNEWRILDIEFPRE